MKRLLLFPIIASLVFLAPACSEDDEGITPDDGETPAGRLTSATDCKTFNDPAVESILSSSESCVEYNYDAANKTLFLKHVNAGFNCCPGTLSANITLVENIITIAESEQEAACHCNCLFDLTFEITDLKPGAYRIVMVEPYLHDDDPALSFLLDLTTEPNGNVCVPRVHYPWGI